MSIAIITGASSGLGAEFARQLDSYGLDFLWIIARRESRLEGLSEKLGTPCRIIPLDLAEDAALQSLGAMLKSETPDIRFLVNCAGLGKLGLFEDLSLDSQLEMIDVNLRAVAHLTHMVLPLMKSGACLIHVASAAGLAPLGGFAVYSATKAFVIHFSMALIPELRPRGIHSLAVCPGPVATEFGRVLEQGSTFKKVRMKGKVQPRKVVAKALRDASKKRTISLFGWQYRLFMPLLQCLPRYWMAALSLKALYRPRKDDSPVHPQ